MADRILLIDDDTELCALVEEFLSNQGFAVESVHNGRIGAARALSAENDLVVLDVMLPEMDGFEVLKRVRTDSDVPILMLTARGEDEDRIVGLELGADDYLSKPFNPRELAARISAILKRARRSKATDQPDQAEPITVGDVTLIPATREVTRTGETIKLTTAEFDLLALLLRKAGTVVERGELFRGVLDREPDPFDRSIDMHVSHLRKKLGHSHLGTERIKSIRSVGYIYTMVDAEDQPQSVPSE